MPDVIVLIPGITGSILAHDGKPVWSLSAGAALRAALSLGKSITRLTLAGDDPALDDLGDGVVATGLMPDLHVLPGLGWKIDGYGRIRERLLASFDCTPGDNYFELPYDWRRDNRVAARGLARKAHDWLKTWRQRSAFHDAKLILVGHSMGGIVARLFLELEDGWKSTRALVTYGTPYSGSVNAVDFLFNGFRKGWGPFTLDLSAMLRSFTSVYQLLPSYRCLRAPNGSLDYLDSVTWNVPGVDDARLGQAIDLHRSLRKAVDARLQAGGPGYDVRPIIGDFQPTGCAVRRRGTGIETLLERAPGEDGGDGTVPKISASPHEHLQGWTNAMFSSQLHGSLQNDAAVLDHTIAAIRGLRPGVPVFPMPTTPVSLQVEDVSAAEPMLVRGRPADPSKRVEVAIEKSGAPKGTRVRRVALQDAADGWQEAMLEGLAPGDYRLSVITPGLHPAVALASVVDLATIEDESEGGA